MRITRWTLAAVVALGLALPLQAGELGDKAAALTIKEWVKGKPIDVTTADGKNVYVVEFWATWCGPCRAAIPHLTEMQKKYKDKNVRFIGVSTDSETTVDKVKPFVKEMGDKMNYTVAIDNDGATSKAYMDAFGIRGIPHAFIVNQKSEIIWHDHPMASTFEEAVKQVVEGKFDLAAAKKLIAKREAERRELERLGQYVEEYFLLVRSTGKEKEAAELGEKILEGGRKNASFMNSFAWRILTDEAIVSRDLKLALTAAEAANKVRAEDAYILDTYALALFENGRKKEALKIQETAVKLAKENPAYKSILAELEERLERFRKEAD
ncbi:MAG: redoxin family protein [Phycisphaerae bacterium]